MRDLVKFESAESLVNLVIHTYDYSSGLVERLSTQCHTSGRLRTRNVRYKNYLLMRIQFTLFSFFFFFLISNKDCSF